MVSVVFFVNYILLRFSFKIKIFFLLGIVDGTAITFRFLKYLFFETFISS